MDLVVIPRIAALSGGTAVIGVATLRRGLIGYRTADRIADTSTKQRHDMLPNLVAAVRGLMTFKGTVLTEVTEARAAYTPTDPIPSQAATADRTSGAVRSLFAVVERYPDFKSGTNVLELQGEIERIERIIADRRELYNDQVYRYDTKIATVPTIILAWLFRWVPRAFFEADPVDTARPDVELTSA